MSVSGSFLDIDRDKPPVCVVLTALSPGYLRASIASNSLIEKFLVYPVDQRVCVMMLISSITNFTLPDDVLDQIEALTVGHPRAIERAGLFISTTV